MANHGDAPANKTRIGVLALQGSFREHMTLLQKVAGVEVIEVRTAEELESVAGLVIPGGESTTMALVAERWGLIPKLQEFAAAGKPIWGTCAGMIFLAERAEGRCMHIVAGHGRAWGTQGRAHGCQLHHNSWPAHKTCTCCVHQHDKTTGTLGQARRGCLLSAWALPRPSTGHLAPTHHHLRHNPAACDGCLHTVDWTIAYRAKEGWAGTAGWAQHLCVTQLLWRSGQSCRFPAFLKLCAHLHVVSLFVHRMSILSLISYASTPLSFLVACCARAMRMCRALHAYMARDDAAHTRFMTPCTLRAHAPVKSHMPIQDKLHAQLLHSHLRTQPPAQLHTCWPSPTLFSPVPLATDQQL